MTGEVRPERTHWFPVAGTVVLVAATAAALIVPSLYARSRFVRYPELELASIRNILDYKGRPVCQSCHPSGDARIAGDPIELCARCHSFAHKNHPVGVAQKPPRPAGIPLGKGDTIVCHSCHDPHDLKKNRYGLRPPFAPLCKKCHPGH